MMENYDINDENYDINDENNDNNDENNDEMMKPLIKMIENYDING